MPNSPHPLTAAIAARLPADCPAEVLLEAQRNFVRPLLDAVLRDAEAELKRVEERRLPRGLAEEHVGITKMLIAALPKTCFAQMMVWIKDIIPAEMNARDAMLALTYDARRAWAKEMVYEIGATSPGWERIAPDMQDAIAAEVAEAWLGGLMQRNLKTAFALDLERMVGRMTQAALYKWLTDPEREPWEIKQYYGRLRGAYAKKIQAQFSDEQWTDIHYSVPPTTDSAHVNGLLAEAERQAFIG